MLNTACSQLRRAPVHGSLHQFLKKMNICSWSESMAFICLGLSSSSKRHSFRITAFSLTLPIPDQLCLKLRWICLFHPSWTISSWVYSSWICCKWSRMLLLTLWLGLGVMSHQSSNTLLTKYKTFMITYKGSRLRHLTTLWFTVLTYLSLTSCDQCLLLFMEARSCYVTFYFCINEVNLSLELKKHWTSKMFWYLYSSLSRLCYN